MECVAALDVEIECCQRKRLSAEANPSMNADPKSLIPAIEEIARSAGARALTFYGSDSPIDHKADNSPLTLADRASHEHIVAALDALEPGVPVVSEESEPGEIANRRSSRDLFLVDPLDGTKEFIKQSGEFTINIALVRGSTPVLGVVHVPVLGVTYSAWRDAARGLGGAWKKVGSARPEPIHVRRADLSRITIVASRDHAGPVVDAFLARLRGAETASMGSSLKFCLVAEGRADFYPRVVPTMEWDTAAAQCILEAAGGRVTDLEGRGLVYNKEDLRNPSLLAFGDDRVDWPKLFRG
jgi:3'(2'), 5'-bisphosphate nucleotidase